MKRDKRDARAIELIDCPRCGAKAGEPCRRHRPPPGRPACCDERRKASQATQRILGSEAPS